MSEDHLAENIACYRRKKGLSQEKLSEYMNVSRQAVTKWEADSSRPSSENLTRLAQLFGVDVETLLGNEEAEKTLTQEEPLMRGKTLTQEEPSIGKLPWIFIGISALCILVSLIRGSSTDTSGIGTLICMFVLCVPIQLFLHVYFSNAVKNTDFSGIAGYDDRIRYDVREVKKLLIRIDLHIGVISAVSVFLLFAMSISDLKTGRFHDWMNGILLMLYILNFVAGIGMDQYKAADKIYCDEADQKRAKRSIPAVMIYVLLLGVGMGLAGILFAVKGIENNTLPAIKTGGLLLAGIISATAGFFLEENNIQKWDPQSADYKMKKTSLFGLFICLILYGLMCV